MAQVTVTIAGKVYRMACGDGEEAHLEALAADLDGKIGEFRAAFGEIGDMRLHVMAALAIADELSETRRKLAAIQADAKELQRALGSGDERIVAAEGRMAESIVKAAERIERIARTLGQPAQVAG